MTVVPPELYLGISALKAIEHGGIVSENDILLRKLLQQSNSKRAHRNSLPTSTHDDDTVSLLSNYRKNVFREGFPRYQQVYMVQRTIGTQANELDAPVECKYNELIEDDTPQKQYILQFNLSTISPRLQRFIRGLPSLDEETKSKLIILNKQFMSLGRDSTTFDINNPVSFYTKMAQRSIRQKHNQDFEVLKPDADVLPEKRVWKEHFKRASKAKVVHHNKKMKTNYKNLPGQQETETQLQESKITYNKLNRAIELTILNATKSLKLKNKYTKSKYEKEMAATTHFLSHIIQRQLFKCLKSYWLKWVWIVRINKQYLDDAATKIETFWRYIAAINEYRYRLQSFQNKRERITLKLSDLLKRRETAAFKIQRWRRRIAFLNRLCRTCISLKQISKLQSYLRRKRKERLILDRYIADYQKMRSAIRIQCLLRCKKAYKFKALRQQLKKLKAIEISKVKRREKIKECFKQHGAAIVIRDWWLLLQNHRETRILLSFHRRRNAIKLQGWWRSILAKQQKSFLLRVKAKEDSRKAVLATKLQATYRGYLVRRHNCTSSSNDKKVPKRRQFNILQGATILPIRRAKSGKLLKILKQVRKPSRSRQGNAALSIQKVFRGHKARKRVRKLRRIIYQNRRLKIKEAKLKVALSFQRLNRRRKARNLTQLHKRNRCAKRIQHFFRRYRLGKLMKEHHHKVKAAKCIQAFYRGLKEKRLRVFRIAAHLLRTKAAMILQRAARTVIFRKRMWITIENQIYKAEIRLAGREEFAKTFEVILSQVVCESLHGSLKHNGIFQDIFKLFSNSKAKEITSEKFLQLIRESGLLEDKKDLNRAAIDVIFAKSKPPNRKGLNFAEFKTALLHVATAKWDIDSRVAPRLNQTTTLNDQTKLLHLVNNYLIKAPVYSDVATKMKNAATERIELSVKKIQRCYRVFRFVVSMKEASILLQSMKQQALEHRAACLIQSNLRKLKAKSYLNQLITTQIVECFEPAVGKPYWYNYVSKTSSWEKPRIVKDIHKVKRIYLPDDDDEFIVTCMYCKQRNAKLSCLNCESVFCDECARVSHVDATVSSHSINPIVLCVSCNYQAAARHCFACQKPYCCCCFMNIHSDNNMAHRWKPILLHCLDCGDRAVKWKCVECDDTFCTKCFQRLHSKGSRALHKYLPLKYQTLELEAKQVARERDRKIDQFKATYIRREQKKQSDRLEGAVLQLQAHWRGSKARKSGLEYLKQQRKAMRNKMVQLKQDEIERKKIKYRIKEMLGTAPVLPSDTPETKLQKSMGWKGTTWGRAITSSGVLPVLPAHFPIPGCVKISKGDSILESNGDLSNHLSIDDWIVIRKKPYKIINISLLENSCKGTTSVTLDTEVQINEKESYVAIQKLGKLSPQQEAFIHGKRATFSYFTKLEQALSTGEWKRIQI